MNKAYGPVFSFMGLAVLLAALLQYQTALFALAAILATLGVWEVFFLKDFAGAEQYKNQLGSDPLKKSKKVFRKILKLARHGSHITSGALERSLGISGSKISAYLEHLVSVNRLVKVVEGEGKVYYIAPK
ncbi:MAG: hypothetical protein JNN11_04940 [Candidatus Doudnabacteria bacterium]|nr:hypothetical protein [Candidatus Doudnabacteria bacterium]